MISWTAPSRDNCILGSRSEDDNPRPLFHAVGIHAARLLRARQFPSKNKDTAAGHRQVQGRPTMVGETGKTADKIFTCGGAVRSMARQSLVVVVLSEKFWIISAIDMMGTFKGII